MSDDPTRPVPSGWPEQPARYSSPEGYGPPDWGQRGRRDQGDWGGPGGGRGAAAPPRRRHRGLTITAIVVVVLLALLAIGDRVAAGVAENVMASEIKSQGFPVKPKVTIEGFPFLTQLAARNFHQIDISASNVKEGSLNVASVNATLHGVHITSGFNGATVDQTTGTALITFAGLSSAAGLGDGMTLSNAGHNELKASINLGFISGNAIAQVQRSGSHQIEVKVIDAGQIPLSALGNARDFTVSLPSLPAGMTVQNVSVTGQGVVISISGSHTTFSQ